MTLNIFIYEKGEYSYGTRMLEYFEFPDHTTHWDIKISRLMYPNTT